MRHMLASSLRIGPGIRWRRFAIVCALIGILVPAPASIMAQVCGNGVREGAEQCDDGNRASFDACSANCRFEQTQRINQLLFESTPSTACPKNAFGGAFTGTAQSQVQAAINASIGNGSTSILFYLRGLTDPTGVSAEPSLQIGVFNAAPQSPTGAYSGSSDVDWWYAVDEAELDTSQRPLSQLSGNITSGMTSSMLTAGPGSSILSIDLATPVTMSVSSLMFTTPIGSSSTPMSYVSGTDRGHLTSENLDSLLQSFESTGAGSPVMGSLCGNVSADSLARSAVPPNLLMGSGADACTQNYTSANSLLDVIVSGCVVVIITAVKPTQPDQIDPGAPAAGAGGPYKLTAGVNHVVNSCKDKNDVTVDLATCLTAAAYSFYFGFSTDRVIAKSTSASDVIFHDDFDAFP